LLNGNFSNKNFQIGAYSNETAKVSIGATNSNTIGHTRFETVFNTVVSTVSTLSNQTLTVKLSGVDGYPNGYEFQAIAGTVLAKDGYKAVADMMNGVSDKTGVKVKVNNTQIMSEAVGAGTIQDLTINGVTIGNITVKANDSDNALIAAINAKKDETGVEASLQNGRLVLAAKDGRAINVDTHSVNSFTIAGGVKGNFSEKGITYLGQLTFIRQDARDIKIGLQNMSLIASHVFSGNAAISNAANASKAYNQTSVNLKYMNSGTISATMAKAMGFFNGN
uniref:flagellin hook IN motif-containing protein n=1 Tax=Campylobacter devanensis TaxID=3161138 RepID=UPI002351359A